LLERFDGEVQVNIFEGEAAEDRIAEILITEEFTLDVAGIPRLDAVALDQETFTLPVFLAPLHEDMGAAVELSNLRRFGLATPNPVPTRLVRLLDAVADFDKFRRVWGIASIVKVTATFEERGKAEVVGLDAGGRGVFKVTAEIKPCMWRPEKWYGE
jgi:hypothetical protein